MTVPPDRAVTTGPGVTGAVAAEPSTADPAARLGTAALIATAASVALSLSVAALGPSLLEPALPGEHGQPPWALGAYPSPYLAVALAGAAILTGIFGLACGVNALRHGWRVSPRLILTAGIISAVALALLPPFGSSDHLSYAAYGQMAITGHNPYTTTPDALARLGDPVAAAVQDWRHSPSVYGPLAIAGQALAARIGGDSARLIVFVLSVLNLLAFVATGLILHWLGRADPARQLRAALLWTFNPLMLLVLVAGAHVDSQAIVFGVAAVAIAAARPLADRPSGGRWQRSLPAAGAGALVGLGFAIKVTTALVGAGLAIGLLLAWQRQRRPGSAVAGQARPGRLASWPAAGLASLAAGFGIVAAAALLPWGTAMFGPALRAGSYVSIGSPWRVLRSAARLAIGVAGAQNVVKAGALVLAAWVLVLLLRHFWRTSDQLIVADAFAVVFAWLLAWPYVLPWYDGLGWALLALLPSSRLDWLMLTRTAALAIGYLPARGITLPGGLRWLEIVVRTAITPALLLAALIATLTWLRPASQPPVAPS
jgi:hypothetical protein